MDAAQVATPPEPSGTPIKTPHPPQVPQSAPIASIKERKKALLACTKRKSAEKRYGDALRILLDCGNDELAILKIELKSDLGSWERLSDYKSIAPLSVSLVSLLISAFNVFFSKLLSALDINSLLNLMSGLTLCISGFVLLALLMFAFLSNFSSRKISKTAYLLDLIETLDGREPA